MCASERASEREKERGGERERERERARQLKSERATESAYREDDLALLELQQDLSHTNRGFRTIVFGDIWSVKRCEALDSSNGLIAAGLVREEAKERERDG